MPALALVWQFAKPFLTVRNGMLAGAALVVAGSLLYARAEHAGRMADQQKLNTAHAQATQAAAQTQTGQQAAAIADQGRAKADVTVHIQQENSNALLTATGAQQGVDPQLYAALIGGLCRYAVAAGDPRCAGLRKPDTAVVPPADSGPPATGGVGRDDSQRSGLSGGPA